MKAFPCEWVEWHDKIAVPKASTGMDLRDYFAAQAMHNLITLFASDSLIDDANERRLAVANAAYAQADAMMKARGE